MAKCPRDKLDRIRELLNNNKVTQAKKLLSTIDPSNLGPYDRGYYYYLAARFDYFNGNYRVQNVNRALRLLKPHVERDDLYHWALYVKGVLFWRSHQLKRAAAIFKQLEHEATQAGHYLVEASTLQQLGQYVAATGQPGKAEEYFSRAIDRYCVEGVKQERRATIHNRAMWLARYGLFSQSQGIYLADPVSVEEWGGRLTISYTLNQAFNLALRRRVKEALHMLQMYYDSRRADAAQNQIFYVNRGVALLMAGRYEEALEDLYQALDTGLKSHHATMAQVYKWIACCHIWMGSLRWARQYARRALGLALRSSECLEIGGAYFVLGWADAVERDLRYMDPVKASIYAMRAKANIILALREFGDIGACWDLAMVQYRAAHLGIFPTRQNTRLVRLAKRYFRSEGIRPPSEWAATRKRLGQSIQEAGKEKKRQLKKLLDLD